MIGWLRAAEDVAQIPPPSPRDAGYGSFPPASSRSAFSLEPARLADIVEVAQVIVDADVVQDAA